MLLIPLDNRPVCYDLPVQIAKSGGIKLEMPPREALGGLNYQADFEALYDWTKSTIRNKRVTSAVVALDTLAYGGLIPSRWSEEYYDDIIERINAFFHLFKMNNVNVYGFSTIMRISNNNINEEEKEYWSEYGTLIYQYSNLLHKAKKIETPQIQNQLNNVLSEIPQEILEDYISTRERNFAVNQHYLDMAAQGAFECLVLCQDDCAKWGINVIEAENLKAKILQLKLQNKTIVHPGTDEVAASLLVKAHLWPNSLSVYPIYTLEKGKEILANYEDRPIKKAIEGQIKMVGAKKSNSIGSADLVLVVHLPELSQGDHIFDYEPEGTAQEAAISKITGLLKSLNKPIAIADILWANGGDPELIDAIIKSDTELKNLYGYAGWNTASNTIGSALAIGLIRVLAEKEGTVNGMAHKKLLINRFAEDWAYQALVRQKLEETNAIELNNKMFETLEPLLNKFEFSGEISFRFPWSRLFEVEASIK
jgi:hypothetical protein